MSSRNVRDVLNNKILEDLSGTAVEQLAPNLGSIVYGILEGAAANLYVNPQYYLEITYITKNFGEILGDVFEALRRGGTYATMLNLDMGTGKTHLMSLILHLFLTVPSSYDQLRGVVPDKLRELEKLGYSLNIANRTAILPIDLRHPYPEHFLKAFAKSLRNVGDEKAAEYIEELVKRYEGPELISKVDHKKLARDINHRVNIIILLDELFYGVFHERELLKELLKFLVGFISARRVYSDNKKSALVALVATAREDYNRWEIERVDIRREDKALYDSVTSFLQQLSRIISHSETTWLDVEESMRIIYSRLGLSYNPQDTYPFSPHFREFVERVVKADSDIPQAQHLRSLIKAMALFAKAAYDEGAPWVTPAHITEEVIGALFPPTDELGIYYKSALGQSLDFAREKSNKALEYAIRAVFAFSIVGDIEKIINAISEAKSGRGAKIPAASEKDIEDVLKLLGFSDKEIASAVKLLDEAPNIYAVKAGGAPRYFALYGENLYHIYVKLVEQGEERLLERKADVAREILGKIPAALWEKPQGDWYEFKVVEFLPSKGEALNPNKFYIYVVLDAVKGDDVEKWLRSRGAHNLAVIVPDFDNADALRSIVSFKAVFDAIIEFVERYLQPERQILKARLEREKELRLFESIASEVLEKISGKLGESLSLLRDGLYKLLSNAYWYSPAGEVKRLAVEARQLRPQAPRLTLDDIKKREAEVKERLYQYLNIAITDVAHDVAEQVAKSANFYYSLQKVPELRELLREYLLRNVEKYGEFSITADMTVLEPRPSQYIIIAPELMKKLITQTYELFKNERGLEASLSNNKLIIKKRAPEAKAMEAISVTEVSARAPQAAPPIEAKRAEAVKAVEAPEAPGPRVFSDGKSLIDWLFSQLNELEEAEIKLAIAKGADAGTLKLYLMPLRDYIKEGTARIRGREVKLVVKRG